MAKAPQDFPLFLHATGQWAKKVRGKLRYFGTDKAKALNRWLDEKDALLAGRTPRAVVADGCSLRDLVNQFLTSKKSLLSSGELSPVTWRHYFLACEILLSVLGKDRLVLDLEPSDFERLRSELAKTRGAYALAGVIQRVRTLFKYAWEEGLIEKPVRFGSVFKKPSKKAMRQARNEVGPRLIDAAVLEKMLTAATVPMRAMILLGVNCGFGNTDVATLPQSALDLDCGWVNFPRPKTAIPRRCPLWPETVKAIRDAIKDRPKPKHTAHAGLVFVTKYGHPWVRVNPQAARPGVLVDSVRLEFDKLLAAQKAKRKGLSFYALRHTFRTIADTVRDTPAIDRIMGHGDESMGDKYREWIGDERLKAVTDAVRAWLKRTQSS